ncbi:hypothetical protein T261_0121 [Streptomyces lydicus]|nr:hypothetical protein T261_0121 [Streptomyces lydicus]
MTTPLPAICTASSGARKPPSSRAPPPTPGGRPPRPHRPALHAVPVHAIAIAIRWGFPRASGFSRAYRAAYGTTPKDNRHQAFHRPK